MESLLPYALAFAAGAMVYVVIDEVIPLDLESRI
jgi:zinc transporter ZupT